MPHPSNTTIIFVPGAWHSPESFEAVASHLRTAGYTTDFVHLASVGAEPPLADFEPDVTVIRSHIQKAVDAGQRVVMVMHSYGSIPTCEAVHAFIIPANQSLIGAFGGNDLPWFSINSARTVVTPLTPETIFYNDLPEQIQQDMVFKLRPHSYQTMHSKLQHASWMTVPSTYLFCERDQAIPLAVQEMMVRDVAGGMGVSVRQERVDAGHSPFLSKVGETAEAIRRAAEVDIEV